MKQTFRFVDEDLDLIRCPRCGDVWSPEDLMTCRHQMRAAECGSCG